MIVQHVQLWMYTNSDRFQWLARFACADYLALFPGTYMHAPCRRIKKGKIPRMGGRENLVRIIMVYLWADHVTGNADSPIIIDSGLPCSVLHGSVIGSNNCTNSDAGIYNMYQCDAVKGGYSSFVLNITMKKIFAGGDVIMLITIVP